MNAETFLSTLKSIPDDNSKNVTFKNIISHAEIIKWKNLVDIIGCYSNDNSKIEAITIFVTDTTNLKKLHSGNPATGDLGRNGRTSISSQVNPARGANYILYSYYCHYFSEILDQFSLDSNKVAVVKILRKHIHPNATKTASAIIKTITSDSSKMEALHIIMPEVSISHDSGFWAVPSLFSSDSNKIDAFYFITKDMIIIDGNNLVSTIKNISSVPDKIKCIELASKKVLISSENILAIIQDIPNDFDKVKCIELIPPEILSHKDIVSILRNIADDNFTLSALKIFIKFGMKVTPTELLEICHTVSSNSAKYDCILAFDKLAKPIVYEGGNFIELEKEIADRNEFCKALAAEINDPEYYLKAAEKLKLYLTVENDHIVVIKTVNEFTDRSVYQMSHPIKLID